MVTSRSQSSALSWQRNSSHSKIQLTRNNYSGPSLHSVKSRKGRADDALSVLDSNTAASGPPMSEADIHALPESSDEEENAENTDPKINVKRLDLPAPSLKRKSPVQSRSKRSKRSKLQDEPDVSDAKTEATTKGDNSKTSQRLEFDVLAMSSSSQKRTFKKYHRPSLLEPPSRPASAGLKAPPPLPPPARAETLPKVLNVPQTLSAPPEAPKKVLNTYTLSGTTLRSTPASSGASQATSPPEPADLTVTSPRSSPATTPLSDKFLDIEDVNQEPDICPYCKNKVVRSRLSNPTIDLDELRFLKQSRQQDFCQQHSLADARVYYDAQNFPHMKWSGLKERITKHVPKLKGILQREIPSHFLDQIDTRIADMKNRKQIRSFLAEQGKDQDSFPPGYYGTKGTHIMAEVIASELSHCLSGRDTDTALKALGVGPYVSFVLVPECTTFLVMEDMAVSEEAARSIMRESSHAGVLIHPEDDNVTGV